jgi:hypothetical protein
MNTNELSRECSWNGSLLRIVENVMVESEVNYTQNINELRKRVIVSELDLIKPKVGEFVNFDDEEWEVVDVRTPLGHLIIDLLRMT